MFDVEDGQPMLTQRLPEEADDDFAAVAGEPAAGSVMLGSQAAMVSVTQRKSAEQWQERQVKCVGSELCLGQKRRMNGSIPDCPAAQGRRLENSTISSGAVQVHA